MQVVLRSEVSDRDCRVLDVPSRPALAPRPVPPASGLLHLLDDPVLDVRDVLQIEQVVPFVAEEAGDDIECDVGLRMAHVRLVLRGEPANKHRHAVGMEGNELLLLPGERVVDSDGHRAVRMKAARIKVLERHAGRVRFFQNLSIATHLMRKTYGPRACNDGRPWRVSSPPGIRRAVASPGPADSSGPPFFSLRASHSSGPPWHSVDG